MSNPTGDHPYEELQRRIQEALQGARSALSPAPVPSASAAAEELPPALRRIRGFSLRPKDARDYLNRFVVQQHEAKKVLSVAICDHYNHVRQCLDDPRVGERHFHKQNILLLGPTGVGKTHLMRTLARLVGVPYVKADATKFTETGYVGGDVEDLVRDLVRAAGGDVNLAQYGIIYIDEIDKLAAPAGGGGSGGRDISGRGVQTNLLKLMEDSEVSLHASNDMAGQMQAMMDAGKGGRGKTRPNRISTRHILFIVSGAFDRLAESVKKRVDSSMVGFGSPGAGDSGDVGHYLKQVETADLVRHGFEPEFIGRLPVRVICEPLRAEDLARILTTAEENILEQYKLAFKGYGLDFRISPEAIQEIARLAHREGTGARGLMTVFERVFREFKFELPNSPVRTFDVTPETIANPRAAVEKILAGHAHLLPESHRRELEEFAKRFTDQHGITLLFSEAARTLLGDTAKTQDRSMRSLCEDRFKDLANGLRIIAQNRGLTTFMIDADFARDPAQELSRLVVESFGGSQGKGNL